MDRPWEWEHWPWSGNEFTSKDFGTDGAKLETNSLVGASSVNFHR